MFMGGFAPDAPILVDLTVASLVDTATSPADAAVIATMTSAGTLLDNGALQQTWLVNGAAADYDLYVTNSGDALTSGTLNTWLNLGTNRAYRLDETGFGTKTAPLTMQIRDASSLQVLDTAVITLTCTVDI